MEHKGVRFEVVQTTNPCCWKWTAFFDVISSLTGIALTRAHAVLDAELVIEKALERQETFKELVATQIWLRGAPRSPERYGGQRTSSGGGTPGKVRHRLTK